MNKIHSSPASAFNMDSLQLHAAARCLANRLSGAKVVDLLGQPGGFCLRLGKDVMAVQIFQNPRGIWLSPDMEPSEANPFIGLARQQLQGYALKALDLPYRDRILFLRFEKRHLSGRRDQRCLVVEWRGPRSNIILLEEHDKMRFAWRWDDVSGEARVLPQQPYNPPPGLREHGPLWFLGHHLPTGKAQATLLASAQNAMHHCQDWYHLEQEGRFLFYPIPLPGWICRDRMDFLSGWPRLIAQLSEAPRSKTEQILRKRFEKRIAGLRAILAKVDSDIAAMENTETYRRWGQALYALPDGIPATAEVESTDYHANPPIPIIVPIEAGKGLHQQAETYFKLARKADRGLSQARQRRLQLEAHLNDAVRRHADWVAQGMPDTAELAAHLDPSAHPQSTRLASKAPPDNEPLRIQIDTYEILVGRSARQNDHLTFKLARPWDIWMHVQDHPGAHVVIRLGKHAPRPPDAILAQAAELALRHSPRAGKSADIDWTRARFVTRKPGGSPGQVLYREFKTWRVTHPADK